MLNSKPFDLVLLDIMMPNMNGYEVLAAMKASDSFRHIPVIMISAVDEIESVIRCIELGAEDYLSKPFNPTLLRARVGACLERKRLHDQVTARTRELSEALEQQTATSEVLSVISGSPGNVEHVFQKMLENATRACDARFANLLLVEDGAFRTVALHNAPPAFAEERRRNPVLRPHPGTGLARVAESKQTVQIADAQAESAYHVDPARAAFLELAGAEVATQRSFIMIAIVLIGIMVDRPTLTFRTLTVAAFVVLLLAPEAIVHPSFQMSFAAATTFL